MAVACHVDAFATPAIRRLWERVYGEDARATPFQSPGFHRLYHQYAGTSSAILSAGPVLLPMSSREIGYGLRVRGLSPAGQYGGAIGGTTSQRQGLLQHAERHGGLAEACLKPGDAARFSHARAVFLDETSLLLRTLGAWSTFRPTKRRRRVSDAGVTVERFGVGEAPPELYALHRAQHARWQTAPMPRGLHDGLFGLEGARTYVLYARSGEALAYYLTYLRHGVCYSHRGISTPAGRHVDAHRVLHEAVLRDLPREVDVYDLGSSAGIAALKTFKLDLGAADVPLVTYRRPTPAAHLRAVIGAAGQLTRGLRRALGVFA